MKNIYMYTFVWAEMGTTTPIFMIHHQKLSSDAITQFPPKVLEQRSPFFSFCNKRNEYIWG